MHKRVFTFLLAWLVWGMGQVSGQSADDPTGYDVNYWVTGSVIAGGGALMVIGQDKIRRKADFTEVELGILDPSAVPGIDRIALRQDISKYMDRREFSDFAITYGLFLPVFLGLDKEIRRDWLDVLMVYAEAQVAVAGFYAWAPLGPILIDRTRPIAYYTELPLEEREWGGNRNSWYSGHTSTLATTTFFMAKAMLDYNPDLAGKEWLVYGLAALPPAYFGWKRVQALKHFPTDVIGGFVIGALGGVLIPELHKKKDQSVQFSLAAGPQGGVIGLTLDLR